MLKRFISKKLLAIYFLFIVPTWIDSVLNPTLVRMIIDNFQTKNLKILWQILMLGILGNMLIVLGLAGKCYFYTKIIADFNTNIKEKMFATFLYLNLQSKCKKWRYSFWLGKWCKANWYLLPFLVEFP